MITEQEIINFIENEFWKSNLISESDIFKEVGIDGDDCEEFLVKYSEKYSIAMNDFLWYFPYQEEGSINFNFGNLFFKNPHQRVKEIPITPKILTEFANSKKWTINYPEHKLPKHRYDMYINWIFVISLILFIILLKTT